MKKKLKDFYAMVEDIDTAMFTTRRRDKRLVSRPMANQVAAAGANLWFVTYEGAPKLKDLAFDPHVNLSYYKDRTREWVSVSGLAKISTNRKKIKELYRPRVIAHSFPAEAARLSQVSFSARRLRARISYVNRAKIQP